MKVEALIIGAARSGTTTIYKYLEQHEQICFSTIKEIHYFTIDDLFKRGEKYYHSLFENCENKTIIGADTYLFISHKSIKRIYEYNPNMKFIVMLREPVARAFSGYNYSINNGHLNKNIDFLKSIELEKNELQKNSSIEKINNLCNLYQSKYYFHLSEWIKIFPPENFLILKTDELRENKQSLLNKISTFFQISDFKEIEEIKANKGQAVKNKKIEQILLNRNRPIRKVLRVITPNFMKKAIFRSKIIDKLHSLNKSDAEIKHITDQEKEIVKKLLKDDLLKLEKNFNINFHEN